MEGEGQARLLHGRKYTVTWSQNLRHDLDEEIVTVHATFDEQIPPRSQEYYEEIDNLSAEMSDKPEDFVDYMYLVGLRHVDDHLPFVTTRVVIRKGLIVVYRKLAQDGNDTEEQTPIHIKDVEKMTHTTNQSDNIFTSLRRELDVDVGVECEQRAKQISCNGKTENLSRKTRQLLNVKNLGNILMYLTSSQKEHIMEPQSLKEA